MTDLANAMPASDSTTLDPGAAAPSAAGGGTPTTVEEPSLRDSIAAAVKESTPEEPAPDADKDADPAKDEADKEPKESEKVEAKKAEKADEKPETADKGKDKKPAEPDGKLQAKEKERADTKDEAEKRYPEPPKTFLPDAKEKWTNVPRPVQRDIANLVREHETQVTQYREAAERYERIRQYDEIVRQNGREGVHETLAEVAQLEDLMGKNPIAALNQILLRAGPRKPDGTPVNLFELAQAVVKTGQDGYNKAVAQPAQQQGPDPQVEQLKRQLAQVQEQAIETSIIGPFKANHPRYDELKGDIALFLQSGKIPASLSPQERLEAAYDMAARINPASHAEPDEPKADPDPGSRAGETFSDSKSIKSTPGAVSHEHEPDRGGSIREELERAMRMQRRA